jgi:hypothetical protein
MNDDFAKIVTNCFQWHPIERKFDLFLFCEQEFLFRQRLQ